MKFFNKNTSNINPTGLRAGGRPDITERVAAKAKSDKSMRFNSLLHILGDVDYLKQCFYGLNRYATPGLDGITMTDYEEKLRENIEMLVRRLREWRYYPMRIREIEIPKENGKKRKLGIPTTEDKIIQEGIKDILSAIFEPIFQEFSYGGRPNRSAHLAIIHLHQEMIRKSMCYILKLDIESFFDSIDREWLIHFLEKRIADSNFIRLIRRFLKSNRHGRTGIPQGWIMSPVLANIYLHFVLDDWFEKYNKDKGNMIRYLDDLIVVCPSDQLREELCSKIGARLSQFGLRVNNRKIQITDFVADANTVSPNKTSDGFNFLGLTHLIGNNRTIITEIEHKRYQTKLEELKRDIEQTNSLKELIDMIPKIKLNLEGYRRYYDISTTIWGIVEMETEVENLIQRKLYRLMKSSRMHYRENRLSADNQALYILLQQGGQVLTSKVLCRHEIDHSSY